MINIKRGLDLPITGSPQQSIDAARRPVRSVAVLGRDYVGMKPTMAVAEGDRVKTGQVIFSDKKTPGVLYTAPASGVVTAVNRGEKRVFQSLVIEVDGDDAETFASYEPKNFDQLTPAQVQENLVQSGLWTAFRTRPFSKVPAPDTTPHSIFVTAMDTHPLAADPAVIIQEYQDDFVQGLKIIARLTSGKVFVCHGDNASINVGQAPASLHSFSGPHPAGLPGTHIHFLDPVGTNKTVWHIGYQDVIAISRLFTTGKLWVERVVSLAGPQVTKPRLVKTQLGANLTDLVQGEVSDKANRIISGSIFGGSTAKNELAFLGRYHNQVVVLEEGYKREFMGWLAAGQEKHSVMNVFLSKLSASKRFSFTTTTNGSVRAMVPVGNYEKIMPLDILPTQLLRSLIVGDTEMAQKLGCLELDEEDLALCSYVCAGKYEYGPILRDNLNRIEQEG
ncbi:Na(+)-translocating NADH-quinone reductase subunit A [Zooshikella marina]|uniref:Na(+)-translocating NADH-quinone reductase subunit A n=1 Tax=Zooshikella ganghwensis TaxID=202772 RepID=UPI001BB02BFC|nr:Na(+)-translocating NADH-quinone reductase subunit A [Zooshikella ganghwensis]MBU2705233.1 Na(+)-translocating NADH-quinone reductase subunit A [Zooshikella ganghwensis]